MAGRSPKCGRCYSSGRAQHTAQENYQQYPELQGFKQWADYYEHGLPYKDSSLLKEFDPLYSPSYVSQNWESETFPQLEEPQVPSSYQPQTRRVRKKDPLYSPSYVSQNWESETFPQLQEPQVPSSYQPQTRRVRKKDPLYSPSYVSQNLESEAFPQLEEPQVPSSYQPYQPQKRRVRKKEPSYWYRQSQRPVSQRPPLSYAYLESVPPFKIEKAYPFSLEHRRVKKEPSIPDISDDYYMLSFDKKKRRSSEYEPRRVPRQPVKYGRPKSSARPISRGGKDRNLLYEEEYVRRLDNGQVLRTTSRTTVEEGDDANWYGEY